MVRQERRPGYKTICMEITTSKGTFKRVRMQSTAKTVFMKKDGVIWRPITEKEYEFGIIETPTPQLDKPPF